MTGITDTFVLANGVKIPCLGFGTWQTPDGEVAAESVRTALEAGYRHIDTAAVYRNEKGVGEGIRMSGIGRGEIFVTSKLWNADRGYDKTLAAFEATLARLGLDYLDLYLIHWPAAKGTPEQWQQTNAETWRAFEHMFDVPRDEMDKFALRSHQKASKAQKEGAFKKEIIPVTYTDKNGNIDIMKDDECVKHDATYEEMAKLPAAFKENGSVTAGNSSPMNDGVGFVVMMSADKAAELGIKPIAKFLGYAVAGVSPEMMGIGPVYAVPKLLNRIGMEIDQFDVIELNEAFAVQSLICIDQLGLDPEKVNPRGGAIALGHPLGATGAILTCKALSYLQDTGGKYGLITMCIGAGMGAAGAIEML